MQALKPTDVPDEWDFYPCRVDDARASLALNFWFRANAPLLEAPTLYWIFIFMRDPDTHGMGSGQEADYLFPITDRIVDAAAAQGLHQVGRLRNKGCWQLAFYGPSGLAQALEAIAKEAIVEREFEVGSKDDVEWGYYFDFLCPDPERWQWIMDRRVVDALQAKGDSLDKTRPVDHCLYFPGSAERQQFIVAARARGFEVCSEFVGEGNSALPFGVEISRTDSVELDHIHEVVMDLSALATESGGSYDGWGTTVEGGS